MMEKIENFSPMGKCLGRRENQLFCLWNLQVSCCWNRMLRNECVDGSSAGHVLHFFCLVLIKSTPNIVYGVARENKAVDLLPCLGFNTFLSTSLVLVLTKSALHQCFGC